MFLINKQMFVLIALIVLLISSGVAFQFIAEKFDQYQYPAKGKMVDVGGHKLHMHYTGPKTNPTVVFDSGCGTSGIVWAGIQPEISKLVGSVSYDRAGYGSSDIGPNPRTCQQMVSELHTLLEKANIPKPYILVGHSLGGANVQLYTNTYPEDVLGVVLVDSAHKDVFETIPEIVNKRSRLDAFKEKAYHILSITRIIRNYLVNPSKPKLFSKDQVYEMLSHELSYKHLCTELKEFSEIEADCQQLKDSQNMLSDKPLIILSANPNGKPKNEDYDGNFVLLPAWQEMQEDLAKLSKFGKQIIAEKSVHCIHFDEPELVIQAINEILKSIDN